MQIAKLNDYIICLFDYETCSLSDVKVYTLCGSGVALSKSMREAASNSDIWLMLNVAVDLGLDKLKLQFNLMIMS